MSTVWVAAPNEADDVARLLIAFRDWFHATSPSAESMAASVALLLEDASTEYLLGALEPGQPACGVCQLRFRHSVWTATPDCWLEDLFVEQRARGGGVGRALVELAFERAGARGSRRIELDTNEANTGAIRLYEALGFSTRSKSHGGLDGRDVFMGRRLQ